MLRTNASSSLSLTATISETKGNSFVTTSQGAATNQMSSGVHQNSLMSPGRAAVTASGKNVGNVPGLQPMAHNRNSVQTSGWL